MLRQVFLQQIRADVGLYLLRYTDLDGIERIGYRHRIRPIDGLGTTLFVALEQANALLEEDTTTAIRTCYLIYDDFDSFPLQVQYALAHLAYSLERHGLSTLLQMNAAIHFRQWGKAAQALRDSTWYPHNCPRAERLAHEIETSVP